MLDDILKLIEYLITHVRENEKNRDELLSSYVKPTYALAETVFNDFLALLYDLRRKIEAGESAQELVVHLESGRIKYLAARMKLRALINRRYRMLRTLPRFEKGIFVLLHGGLAAFE